MELIGFSCREYKAFKKANVELKPITILLGPNSAGKSTLNRILLLLNQSILKGNVKKSVLMIDKKKLSDSRSLFRNYDINNNIEITIVFSLEDGLKKLPKQIAEIIVERFKSQGLFSISNDVFNDFIDDDFSLDSFLYSLSEYCSFDDYIGAEQFDDCMRLLKYFDELDFSNLYVKFCLRYRKGNFVILNEIIVGSGDVVIFKATLKDERSSTLYVLSSDIDDDGLLDKYQDAVANSIVDKLNLQNFDVKCYTFSNDSLFVDFLFLVISVSFSNLKKKIRSKGINYIPPIREFSRESYNFFLGGSDEYTVEADKIVEELSKNKGLVKKINDWFIKSGKYQLVMREGKDGPELKIKYQGLNHSIGGLGSGVSEVLPVLVRTLISEPGAINIIEHPELHLHPRMQADLIDFLLDNLEIENKKKVFLIETHSEYMLHRLRRAVSEGRISSNDIALYFVSCGQRMGSSKIEKMSIKKKGDFKWPPNFSSVLEDTTCFVKNQL